jgi:hypothetical protein
MKESIRIIDTHAVNIHEYGMCGYKNIKQEGYRRKIAWLKDRFSEGMKYKVLYSEEDGAVGGIEYIPGEYAWRPVEAPGYMVIHCIFIIPNKYKGKGLGSFLVESCLADTKERKMHGAAVVTRKGTWMAGKNLFVKNGFDVADEAPPDFELLVKKLNKNAPPPKFRGQFEKSLSDYGKGLVILSSDQCPYTAKAVKDISETAEKTYGLRPKIIELNNHVQAQNSPCVFGTFCILYNGKVIADHPISSTRFGNIINKITQ